MEICVPLFGGSVDLKRVRLNNMCPFEFLASAVMLSLACATPSPSFFPPRTQGIQPCLRHCLL